MSLISHNFDMVSENMGGLKIPLFDMRSVTLNRYWREEVETPIIFGTIKEEYVPAIVKHYDHLNDMSPDAKLLYPNHRYNRTIIFLLNDNSYRCIRFDEHKITTSSFNVSGDTISAEYFYIYKLNPEKMCKTDAISYDWDTSIYKRHEMEDFSFKINKLVREENYCIIYTDIAIFMIENDKIKFDS